MNINLNDDDVRENYLRHLKDNKQFNIYPDYSFAENLIKEMEVKNVTRNNKAS